MRIIKKIDAVLEKLERTVDEHTRYLNLCGNCQIHMMSYVGNGNSGVENSCSMTCPKPPVLVFIQGNDNSAVLVIRPNEVCTSWAGQIFPVHLFVGTGIQLLGFMLIQKIR